MEVEEDDYKEYFEYTMDIEGWNYPLNERDALTSSKVSTNYSLMVDLTVHIISIIQMK